MECPRCRGSGVGRVVVDFNSLCWACTDLILGHPVTAVDEDEVTAHSPLSIPSTKSEMDVGQFSTLQQLR